MAWRVFILLLAAAGSQFAQVKGDAGHQAALELRAGDYTSARQILETALKQSPDNARLWTLHGLTLIRLGNPSEAFTSFRRALQFAPNYYPALEGAAQLEIQSGSATATTTLRRMLTIHPDDHTALRELAFSLMQQRHAGEALPVFKRLAAAQPADKDVMLDLAAVEFLTGKYADVISTLTPLVSKEPADEEALKLLAEAYNLSSDAEKALAVLTNAISANPDATQAYVDYANICLTHGLFQAGIDTVTKGLVRIPDSAPLYVSRGVLYSELAENIRAEADFNRAEQLDPNVAGGAAAKGLAELQLNDLAQAEATIRERLSLQPRDAFFQYLLAEVLIRRGASPGTPDFKEALGAARRSVELKPDLGLARDLLGRLYLQANEVGEAIHQSRLALQYSPTDQKALYHLIVALRKGNRTDDLPALLRRLVRLREQNSQQQTLQHNYALIEKSGAAELAASQP